MARITVEDCIDKFPSRFELVLIASNRARKLHAGDEPTVEKDNDKNTVIALREIADETIPIEDMKKSLIEDFQTVSISEEEEELNLENINEDETNDMNLDAEIKNLVSTEEQELDNTTDTKEEEPELETAIDTKEEEPELETAIDTKEEEPELDNTTDIKEEEPELDNTTDIKEVETQNLNEVSNNESDNLE